MTQPSKVLGFLDIFGAWDPSLAVVMAAALAVSGVGYWLAQQRPQPVLAPKFDIPTKTGIDTPLVAGSALFGIGWGLVGLCPGPALENLATLSPPVIVFCVAMAAGMVAHDMGTPSGRQRRRAARWLEPTARACNHKKIRRSLFPRADILRGDLHVRSGPTTDSRRAARERGSQGSE